MAKIEFYKFYSNRCTQFLCFRKYNLYPLSKHVSLDVYTKMHRMSKRH